MTTWGKGTLKLAAALLLVSVGVSTTARLLSRLQRSESDATASVTRFLDRAAAALNLPV